MKSSEEKAVNTEVVREKVGGEGAHEFCAASTEGVV